MEATYLLAPCKFPSCCSSVDLPSRIEHSGFGYVGFRDRNSLQQEKLKEPGWAR